MVEEAKDLLVGTGREGKRFEPEEILRAWHLNKIASKLSSEGLGFTQSPPWQGIGDFEVEGTIIIETIQPESARVPCWLKANNLARNAQPARRKSSG